jgi:hypothetical protein
MREARAVGDAAAPPSVDPQGRLAGVRAECRGQVLVDVAIDGPDCGALLGLVPGEQRGECGLAGPPLPTNAIFTGGRRSRLTYPLNVLTPIFNSSWGLGVVQRQSRQVPKMSNVWLTSTNPYSAATRSAHRSTAGPATSVVRPQDRHTRW